MIRRKEEGMSSRDVALGIKVSKRRVNQVWRMYLEAGEIPVIGGNLGRPKTSMITEDEGQMIKEAKLRYKFGARLLEPIIERDYEVHIPHNKIHRYLLQEGLAKENPKKKKRRKWIRYERKHSLSAGHMDWYDKGVNGTNVCAIIDDSSRRILGGGEFDTENTEYSKVVFKQVVDNYWSIRPMKELIIDHGSPFGAHRTNDKGDWESVFKRFVNSYGTKIIRARINHPQTNGKIEKWFDCYKRHRSDFNSFQEFVDWYNDIRPHESLDWSILETPTQAFWRKLPTENKLGVWSKLVRW